VAFKYTTAVAFTNTLVWGRGFVCVCERERINMRERERANERERERKRERERANERERERKRGRERKQERRRDENRVWVYTHVYIYACIVGTVTLHKVRSTGLR